MKTYYKYLVLILLVVLFSFCNKEKKDIEKALLEEYLANVEYKNIDTIEDGLYLINTGFSSPETLVSDLPASGDTVVSVYKGYLLSDPEIVFDEADFENPQYYAFKKDPVIPGWELSIAKMKKDALAILIIHSDYAYKGDQVGLIPPFSSLIYEVRIVDIIKSN
ncbi:MAG: FKBP-type peptidyl-prolyl cis-trans isomerase [Bacteroidales bacterium]|nr:FKBP-type peptidyl-prolyl cis-trans isomerase [Bacteroidales bacterium]